MPRKITSPTIVEAAGTKPKRIEEYVGRVNTGTEAVSIARMVSPAGWVEPGQRPEFDEYSLVLAGSLRVETEDGVVEVEAGQAVVAQAGQWVRYSTPAGTRIATVVAPETDPAGVLPFGQTVAYNRGILLGLFPDRTKALAWLRE